MCNNSVVTKMSAAKRQKKNNREPKAVTNTKAATNMGQHVKVLDEEVTTIVNCTIPERIKEVEVHPLLHRAPMML